MTELTRVEEQEMKVIWRIANSHVHHVRLGKSIPNGQEMFGSNSPEPVIGALVRASPNVFREIKKEFEKSEDVYSHELIRRAEEKREGNKMERNALGKIEGQEDVEAVVSLIIKQMDDTPWPEKGDFISYLGVIGSPANVAIPKILEQESLLLSEVRSEMLKGLALIAEVLGKIGDSRQEIVSFLNRFAGFKGDDYLRINCLSIAIESLCRLRVKSRILLESATHTKMVANSLDIEVLPLLVGELSPGSNHTKNALSILGELGNQARGMIPALLAIYETDWGQRFRDEILTTLSQIVGAIHRS